jgi:DNA-directed RNA polymerase subunit RPC12/RpoP
MNTKHSCPNCSSAVSEELFDATMKAVCPNCYTALQLVKAAESVPGLSTQDKAFLNVVGGIAIGVFIGKLFFG